MTTSQLHIKRMVQASKPTVPTNSNTPKKKKSSGRKRLSSKFTIEAPSQKTVTVSCICGILIALTILISNRCSSPDDTEVTDYCNCASAPIKSKTSLHDINPEQLAHARANGLKHPIKNTDDFNARLDSLSDNGILVRIKPNRYYNIRPLTHSVPYLTPEARDLLKLIGIRFQKNLKKAGLPAYKFQISSLLRTVEYQRQLTRVNRNATPSESSHYYATTFDIAYDKYDRRGCSVSDPEIEAILENTLTELRSECRLMIIRERSNKCFHITVVCPRK